jgi:PPM family protein phosphatase
MIRNVAPSTVADLSAAALSDAGLVRSNNEDVAVCLPERGIYGIIDGVGGHAAGEVAAARARDVILDRLGRLVGTPDERVREAIALANNAIIEEAERHVAYHGMTCVLTLALVTDERTMTIGHVGDTRLYKLRGDDIRKLTHDHSPIGEREDAAEITELDAMRHPRRNEVFRDLGSTRRDKDDPDFIEIIREPLEADAAILLCSDGLTDMLQSSAVRQIVRRYAGDPRRVVAALVDAANEAGGRDNVTVVYAEGPAFARAVRSGPAGLRPVPPTTELPASRPGGDTGSSPRPARRSTPERGIWRSFIGSRLTWFGLGGVACAAAVLSLLFLTGTISIGRRTLIVSPAGPTATRFGTIRAAMAAARPGDIVQVEDGSYAEQVFVKEGVDLVARTIGGVQLVRRPGTAGPWVALTARGDLGGRVSGIQVVSRIDAPIDVGIDVAGHNWTIEAVSVEGVTTAGMTLSNASKATVRFNTFENIKGPAVRVVEHSEVTFLQNAFVRRRGGEIALSVHDPARVELARNSFVGYGPEDLQGLSGEQKLRVSDQNVFSVPAQPSPGRSGRDSR